MTIPGLALFYGGLVRTKNMLSVLTQVFAIVCIVCAHLGVLRLLASPSPTAAASTTSSAASRRPSCAASTPSSIAATFSNGVVHPRIRLHLLPDDLRR